MSDNTKLKDLAVYFYTKLFTIDPLAERGDFFKGNFLAISKGQRLKLERTYTMEENWKAVREMGSLKAPGPDGY